MGNSDFKIMLQALLDDTSLTDIEKKLAKKKVKVGLDMDFANSIKDAEKQVDELSKRFKTMFNFKTDSEAMSFTKKYLSDANKLIAQNERATQKAEKTKQAEIKKTNAELEKQNQLEAKQVSDTQSKYYSNLRKEVNTLYSLKNKLLSADKEQTAELEKQVKSTKERINYNNKQLDKKGLKDDSLTHEINNLEIAKQKQLAINEAKLQDVITSKQIASESSKLQKSNTITAKLDTGDYSKQVTTLQSSLEKWGMSADETKAKMSSLKTAYTELQNAKTVDERISAEQKFQTVLKTTQNEVAELKATMASPVKVQDAYNKISSTLKNNSAMSKEAKRSLQEYQATLKNGNVSASGLQNIENGYKNVIAQERVAGRLGNNFVDTIKSGAKSIAQWSISMYGVASAMQGLRSGIENLKEVDNILTEISKTSDSTAAQLKEIGNESYDVASKYGVKNTAYLTGVQEMNRSGFYGKQGQAMAEQSLLAQSAGDMEEEIADKWVLATNAAYKYQGQAEKINAVLDGANEITNRNSVNMTDMAEAMSTVGSNAANTGVKINELSAIIGTSVATTKKDGNEVGTAWKSIFVNLQNTSSSKILGTLDKANAKMTEMKNGVEQMRSPIDILKDLAKTYNSLDSKDPLRSEITRNLGGKHYANILGSTLDNWSSYEKMLGDYSEGGGSALEESKKSAENLTGRLNALSNSWNKFVSTIVSSDGLKTGVNLLNGLVTGVTNLTEKFDALPIIITAIAGGLSGFKNIGIFGTIQDEVTGISKSIGLFGKSWEELKEGFSNFKTNGLSGLFQKSTIDVSAVQKYNEALLTTKDSQKALEISTIGVNAETKSLIASANGAAVSETALATAQKSATVASKAAAIGWKALNVAMNVGVMFLITEGISLAVKGLDNLIHATENAKESISNLESEYSDGVSSLDSMNTELTTTKDRIDELQSKGTLTFTEKDELENLKTQNAELQRSIDLQKEKNKASSTKTVGEIRDDINKLNKGFTSDLNDYSNQKKEVDQDNSYYDTQKRIGADSEYLSNIEESIAQESDVLASFKDSVIQNIQDYQKYKEDIVNAYGDDKTLWDKNTLDMYNSLDEQVQKAYKEIYTNAQYNKLVIEPVFDKDGLSGLQDELLQYFAKNGSLDESELKKKFGSSIIEALKSACSDAGVDFSDMLNDMNKNAQQKVKEIFNAPSTVNSTYSAKQKVNSDAKKDAYDKLSDEDKTIVLNAKIPDEVKNGTEKDFNDWVEKLKSKAKENPIEISVTSAGDSLETMSKDIKNLSSAYSEFKDNGFSDIGTMGGISDAFKDLKSYESFVKVAGDVNSSAEDIQKSFNNLVTEYVYTSGVLDGLTEDTKGLYQSQLEAMGITNASAIVNSDYANALSYAAEKGIDLSKATYEDIMALVNEKEISEETRQAMAALAIEKFKVGATGVGRASDISELEQLAEMAGISKDKLTDLKNAKSALSGKVPGMPTESAQKQADSAIKSTKKKIEKETASYKPTANYSNGKTNSSGVSGGSGGGGGGSNPKSTKQTVDWIERKINVITTKMTNLKNSITDLINVGKKESIYQSLLTKDISLLDTATKGSKKYKKQADKTSLSKSLKKKVRNGTIDISKYSEKTQSKITDYQNWYDKYKTEKEQIASTKREMDEYATSLASVKWDDASTQADKLGKSLDLLKAKYNNLTTLDDKNANLDTQLANQKEQLDQYTSAVASTQNNANKTLSKIKAKNKQAKDYNADGTLKETGLSGKQLLYVKKYNAYIRELQTEQTDLNQKTAEYQTLINDIAKSKFDNIQQSFERRISDLDLAEKALSSEISLLEAKGATVVAQRYQDQIWYEQQKIVALNQERDALNAQISQIQFGTTQWYEAKSAIDEISQSIQDCNLNIAESQNKVTELAYTVKDKLIASMDRLVSEADFYNTLMSSKDMFDSDNSLITDEGLATLGNYVVGKDSKQTNADVDKQMLEVLKANLANSNYSFVDSNGMTQYLDNATNMQAKIDEVYEDWRNQISATYEYENKIIDLMTQKLDSELEALKKLIDAKKEALEAEKSLHDYQKSIADSTKNIGSLQKQIKALQGDNSSETAMRIQKLQTELTESQEDLKEKEYDKYISDQEDMLDNMYERYSSLIENLKKDRDTLLKEGIELADTNAKDIKQTLDEYSLKYDYMSENIAKAYSGNAEISSNVSGIHSTLKTGILVNAGSGFGGYSSSTTSATTTQTPTASTPSAAELQDSAKHAAANLDESMAQQEEQERNAAKTWLEATRINIGHIFGNTKYFVKGTKDNASDYKTKINQALFSNNNKKVLSGEGLTQLQKIFNNCSTAELYDKLKEFKEDLFLYGLNDNIPNVKGFATGGVATFVKGKGEDGLAMVRKNEGIFTPVQTQTFTKEFIPRMDNMIQASKRFDNILGSESVLANQNSNIEVNYEFVLNDVNDANALLHQIQTNKTIRNALEDVTINKLSGKGTRLSVNKYK